MGNRLDSAIVDGYLRYLERRGRAPGTLEAYRRATDQFVAFVGDRQLSRELLAEWQDSLGELKPASRQVHFSVIKNLLRWGAGEELLSPVLWLKVESVKLPEYLPRPIPRQDLERVLSYLQSAPADLQRAVERRRASRLELERVLRTKALFYFLFTTGARIAEALSVDRDDYQDGQALVIQKGGSEKLLLTTSTAQSAVADYLRWRRDDHPALFLSYQANQPATRLTASGATAIWQRLAGVVGVHSFASHRIRHTNATELGEAGVQDSIIRANLGHRSLATTQRYEEVRTVRRRAALEAALEPLLTPAAAQPRFQYRMPLRRRGRRPAG
jgi:integrase/recombinase XerD